MKRERKWCGSSLGQHRPRGPPPARRASLLSSTLEIQKDGDHPGRLTPLPYPQRGIDLAESGAREGCPGENQKETEIEQHGSPRRTNPESMSSAGVLFDPEHPYEEVTTRDLTENGTMGSVLRTDLGENWTMRCLGLMSSYQRNLG
ncbi:uncharacterized protein LOC143213524 isoform X2 [Lasioglossum baleicum]|uniref:uncharacterized protein LOC143213524 isoform X2 n=1 Tax=Lasioglossum baleicum TaxID=434251 RepID=UPI003FCCE672